MTQNKKDNDKLLYEYAYDEYMVCKYLDFIGDSVNSCISITNISSKFKEFRRSENNKITIRDAQLVDTISIATCGGYWVSAYQDKPDFDININTMVY